ncbi:rRNA pseudouridine synthase [Bacteroidetes/Chlorobi group bacterium Naka2016]|jgi:23S rRNA pseudouridine2605 synthase|nr:MAG: rRNA pseudouridine synthase [Bacteroidetes/Chlorobi group bacterium Naka2016]
MLKKMVTKEGENLQTYSKSRIRLNRLIAEAGITSRRKADELIKSGVVKVNGKVVTKLGTVVSLDDLVTVNGKPIKLLKRYEYILLNKPKDTICTLKDEKGRKTVVDLVQTKSRVYPVGRLDRNTTGVLLLTNDGELANRLMHPRYQILRTYTVGLDKPLKVEHAKQIANGVEIDGVKFQKCELFIDFKDPKKVTITLTEGKNREIKRIFEHFGYEVKKLNRKMFANLTTSGLKRGEWRHLTKKEINMLRELVGLL